MDTEPLSREADAAYGIMISRVPISNIDRIARFHGELTYALTCLCPNYLEY